MVIGLLAVGTDEFSDNLHTFHAYQTRVAALGMPVFDQTAYLDIYLSDAPKDYGTKFDVFYKGLIQSDKIKKVYVIPGWEKSQGASAEVGYATDAHKELIYLD